MAVGRDDNTARIWRAGRKLMGYSQVELSQKLGMSQGTISKYESKILIPTLDHWYNFCDFVGIDPSYSYISGTIDGCGWGRHKILDKKTRFKHFNKYIGDGLIRIRELQPFLRYIDNNVSQDAWKRFCSRKIDPDYFIVLDGMISLNLIFDLMKWLKEEKSINADEVIEKYFLDFTGQGKVGNTLKRFKKDPLRTFINHSVEYESVFDYTFSGEKNVRVSPQKDVLSGVKSMDDYHSYAAYKCECLGRLSGGTSFSVTSDRDSGVYEIEIAG
jgi:transcriptional regulator with XRE-family HTH domain